MSIFSVEDIIRSMTEWEGFEVSEARLQYQQRKQLPDSAFCGLNRTYPSYDTIPVSESISKLSQFGHRLRPEARSRIHECLVRKAKAFNVEHGGCWICRPQKSVSEALSWLERKYSDK